MILFDNCIIQAPDGVNLSRCGMKKLNWYLNQGLADIVSDDPLTIRLKFEPSGREGLNDPLLLDGKPNVCVVCGTPEDLTRHHIIPYCFIRHMPLEIKVDIIRDIFPLCRTCHDIYEKKSFRKKQEIAKQLNVTMSGISDSEMGRVRRAMCAASAIVGHGDKIPEPRRSELMKTVTEFLGKEQVNDVDLENLRNYKIKERSDYKPFSQMAAEYVKNYSDFAKEWRTHFVETMNPLYMPEAWKVDRITDNVWVPKRMVGQRIHSVQS